MKRLILALVLAARCALPAADPRPDPNCVTLPTFIFEQRHAITAGVAFLLEDEGRRYLVTAYHVLGPPGGLRAKIGPRDVPREVKGVAALCLGDGQTIVLGAPFLLVEDAKAFDPDGADRDIAIALVKGEARVRPLKFGAGAPEVGSRIWLYARLTDRDRPNLYGAEVTEVTAGMIQYRMDDPSLNMRALSGAPMLAADGTLVGMHLGHGRKDEHLVGAAAPAAAIKERVAAAAKTLDEE